MYPELFSIGSVKVFSYGAMVALGVLIATFLIYRHALARNLDAEKIVDLIFWIVFWGLIGGRILYVLIYSEIYFNNPWEIIKIYKGGLVFHGGLISGVIAAIIFIARNKLAFLKTMDIIVLYLPLGHAIGRIGCFLNGCCFGKPTDLPLGVVFPGHSIAVHPTQLYSSVLLLITFLILFNIEKRKRFTGQIVSLYLIIYGLMRFSIEFLRDNPTVLGFLTIFQCISIVLVFTGLLLYVALNHKMKSADFEKKT